jgi:hypothetical protein
VSPIIKPAILRRFLKKALNTLKGDWVILGGNVLPLLGSSVRPTSDIDLVPLGDASMAEQLQVMEICESLGLPPETANSAAGLFLKRVPGHEKKLVVVEEREGTRIMRPNAALFLRLKSARLTESDLADCIEMLRLESRTISAAERKSLRAELGRLFAAAAPEKRARIQALLDHL